MRFGTDGVRGVANSELTADYSLALGRASARVLGGGRWLIGRDPRISGPMIESALAAGLASAGVDVELLGVVPTPAVAWLAAAENVPAAMISASHNPAGDNGIKLFAAGGNKLGDDVQANIEAELSAPGDAAVPTGESVGTVSVRPDGLAGYGDAVVDSVDGVVWPEGLRVVIDCANGAASEIAPEVLGRLNLNVTTIHNSPDGLNINRDCGSTHLPVLAASVVEHGADVGFAFDGDADRVLAVDAAGRHLDGDQLMAMLAIDAKARGVLTNDTVVVTVMTNLGFRLGMRERGINVVETGVGDRYVLEALASGGHSLGGEQSGHIILPALATTGDGLLSAVQVLAMLARTGRPVGELADEAMARLPQVLVNVQVSGAANERMAEVADLIAEVDAGLGDDGRVLVRPSGTEPVIRVMAEARSAADAQSAVDRIVKELQSAT